MFDFFVGLGLMVIEVVSNYVMKVVVVEKDKEVVKIIYENVNIL